MSLSRILIESDHLSQYINDNNVTLFHYSIYSKDTLLLDPSHFGKNSFTRNDMKRSLFPRIFFYLDPTYKEHFFNRYNKYEVSVPKKFIYDILLDPLKIKESSKIEGTNSIDFTKMFSLVKNKGFKGMYYRPGFDCVVWFYPIKVNKVVEKELV